MDYPILMADIIRSGQHEPGKLMAQFKQVVDRVNVKFRKALISPLTITLGDEFQGVADTMENGIRIIFHMEETIIEGNLPIKLRYVLYHGKIETPINKKSAHGMLGEGLTKARMELNGMKTESHRFSIRWSGRDEQEENMNNAFLIYQNFVDSWKPKDLRTVSAFLREDDYKTVAEALKIDRSSAWRRKKSLNIAEYEKIKGLILFLVKTTDK